VAIFYDQTAVHAVTAYSHPSRLVQSYTVFQDLLEDLGLQYHYVAGAQVEQGELSTKGYRVLVMAQALALCDEAVRQIRAFIDGGGMVIADVLPGRYDSLLRPAFGGSLVADLFGKPGETRQVGQGRTVLMADFPGDYRYRRNEAPGQEARAKLQEWLQPLGLRPVATFSGPGGVAMPGVETVVYAHQGTTFVGVVNGTDKTASGLMKTTGQACVYDVRARQYLGTRTEWSVHLQPGETKLFALCPYEVTGLTVEPQRSAVSIGQVWRAQVSVVPGRGRAGAAHSFVTQVLDPAGKPCPLYAQALPATDQGTASITLPFALNDAPGQWKVRVTETISGKTTGATVELRR
jgi:hypothetical protein